jgi:hypothetical protein
MVAAEEVAAFPDTNIFLHYRPIAELDWRSKPASSVRLWSDGWRMALWFSADIGQRESVGK